MEFEVDKRGRKTDQPIPLDLMSTRFLGKMVLVVPLLVALAAHLAEPGLLTTDKAKKNQYGTPSTRRTTTGTASSGRRAVGEWGHS